MEMIRVEWTRMGKSYCLAGAVSEEGGWRFVRPLLSKFRSSPVRNVGWSAYLMDGHRRWEVFQLLDVQPALPEPPHLEDVWVSGMRSLARLATRAQRRAILEAGRRAAAKPLFGERLTRTRTAAYLDP